MINCTSIKYIQWNILCFYMNILLIVTGFFHHLHKNNKVDVNRTSNRFSVFSLSNQNKTCYTIGSTWSKSNYVIWNQTLFKWLRLRVNKISEAIDKKLKFWIRPQFSCRLSEWKSIILEWGHGRSYVRLRFPSRLLTIHWSYIVSFR